MSQYVLIGNGLIRDAKGINGVRSDGRKKVLEVWSGAESDRRERITGNGNEWQGKINGIRYSLWPVTAATKFCFGRCQWDDAWHGRVSAFGMLKFRPSVQPFLEFLCHILYVTAGKHQCDSWQQPISAPSGGSVTRDLPNNSKWYSIWLVWN